MNLDSRNARALAAGQAAWDNASPPEDDGREDYVKAQAAELLAGNDCEIVAFLTGRGPLAGIGFSECASEVLFDADSNECELLQLVLAVRRGDFELAAKINKRFEPVVEIAARGIVERALEANKNE